jgi:hypothetical protein
MEAPISANATCGPAAVSDSPVVMSTAGAGRSIIATAVGHLVQVEDFAVANSDRRTERWMWRAALIDDWHHLLLARVWILFRQLGSNPEWKTSEPTHRDDILARGLLACGPNQRLFLARRVFAVVNLDRWIANDED